MANILYGRSYSSAATSPPPIATALTPLSVSVLSLDPKNPMTSIHSCTSSPKNSTRTVGVAAYDTLDDNSFMLRVFGFIFTADMPSLKSAWSCSKCPGVQVSSHICPIHGVRIPDNNNNSYYLPLQRPPSLPSSQYNFDNLPPIWTHKQWMAQARHIDEAPTQAEQVCLSRKFRINSVAIVSTVPGVIFPDSFPSDFMHLLENTFWDYVSHMSGNFKGLNTGSENYIITSANWKEVHHTTLTSNTTTVSARPLRTAM